MKAISVILTLLLFAACHADENSTAADDQPTESATPEGAAFSAPGFTNPRVRDLIPGQDKTVGYLTIHNPRESDLVFVRAESSWARVIEFHTIIHDGNMMRMRRLEQVVVPASGTLDFVSGGNHLMMFGVRSLVDGNDITLITDADEKFTVSLRLIPFGVTR